MARDRSLNGAQYNLHPEDETEKLLVWKFLIFQALQQFKKFGSSSGLIGFNNAV